MTAIARGIVDCDLPAELAALLRQVPRGRVTTYGLLAEALGDPAAARWIGARLLDHPHSARCPCHRVVRGNGEAGLYIAGDTGAKLARLRREGVELVDDAVDLTDPFHAFDSTRPMERLTRFQRTVPAKLKQTPLRRSVKVVAGIDVAYLSPDEGVGAVVLVDAQSMETVWSATVRAAVKFPYISGYLAFRELPVMLQAWDALRESGQRVDAVLIDGNGTLHPRRAGIACCFGLLADVVTIGIGKKLLCGRVDLDRMTANDQRPVIDHGDLIGIAVKCRDESRPIFVSAGNHIDVALAARLAKQLMSNHRLPEPLQRADRLSKDAVRQIKG
jgi:deoxyribonuclease V